MKTSIDDIKVYRLDFHDFIFHSDGVFEEYVVYVNDKIKYIVALYQLSDIDILCTNECMGTYIIDLDKKVNDNYNCDIIYSFPNNINKLIYDNYIINDNWHNCKAVPVDINTLSELFGEYGLY